MALNAKIQLPPKFPPRQAFAMEQNDSCPSSGPHDSTSSLHSRPWSAPGAGAVDEDVFRQSFVPSMSISACSPKELTEIIGRIKESLSAHAEEWEKRVDALKSLRALVANGAPQFDEFTPLLKTLEVPVDSCLRDLRSAVVREACITVAYLSQELQNRFDRFAESVLQTLIGLMSNSAKIMASSGIVAIRFVLENTHSPRLFPILVSALSAKSSVTRKCVCEFLEIIFRVWPVNVLEKHLGVLQDSLRRGIYDADQDARVFSRRAFPLFAEKFPDQANSLLQSLDAQKKKLIEKDLISAGLTGSIACGDARSARSPSGSQSNLSSTTRTRPAVTRRPVKPTLGTTVSVSRPPVTHQNDTNMVGRYGRQGSISLENQYRGRKKVSQSQRAQDQLSESVPAAIAGPSQCVVVDFMATTGLRIMPDLDKMEEDDVITHSTGNPGQFYLPPSPPTKSANEEEATSREVSPSRLAFVSYGIPNDNQQIRPQFSYGGGGYAGRNGVSTERGPAVRHTRIPRSQGASREGSPSRSASGMYSAQTFHPSYPGGVRAGTLGMNNRGRNKPSMSSMSDCGDFGDGLSPSSRYPYGSNEDFSETSSQCSDRSGRSVGYRKQSSVRITNNLKEIMALLAGAQWSERKDGLVNLQNYLRSGNQLSREDVLRVTELFNKLFADTQSKVVSLFMDTLQFFIKEYNPLLRDWLYTLLMRLLYRQSHEALGSSQKAIQETLFVLRSHFPLNAQFATCCHFIMDNTQTPNFKVKVCLLEYLKDLILMMNPDTISAPTPEMSLAISRIISWSTEPKSADVRRMASRVVIKLFDLNAASFSTVLQGLPRTIQDRASEILKTYQKTTTGGGIGNLMDGNYGAPTWKTSSTEQALSPAYRGQSPYSPADNVQFSPDSMVRQVTEGIQSLTTGIPSPGSMAYQRRTSAGPILNSTLQYRSPAMTNGTNGAPDGVLRTVQPNNLINQSPIQQSPEIVPSPMVNNYAAPPMPLGDRSQQQQSGRVNKFGGFGNFDQTDEMPPEDIMSEILQELSNHNERYEQRKACMLNLIKLLRDGTVQSWDEHFKPTLLLLLETLGDDAAETRALALKVLQELVRAKPELFYQFAHLFVIKVLEACRDNEKAVIRSAEDCSKSIAQNLPPDLCFTVLTPLINDPTVKISLPAVKMQEQVVRSSTPELVNTVLDDIIPGLIVACNHEDSAMRKASIFCLVAIAMKIGEGIWDHLSDLNVSKKRLLKLYIDRELTNRTTSTESMGSRS
ncbi:unnamed protein product [Calicophoron daubneyi]|uniref:TOG domain-containing protein n=1 Tax=Calicophoron daubneyi TaxID=300641 RepID=A0AAV2TME9_CALDB